MTILIAEDSAVDAIVLRNILTHAGHAPVLVGDGKKALEALEERPEILLVLADVRMPEVGGVDLLRAMREKPTLAGIPVIFVSGAADAKTVQEALTLRPAGYLLKPISEPSRVLELVDQAARSVTPFLTGDEGDPRHRDERNALASGVRALLDGRSGGEQPTLDELSGLAKKAGAPRLAALSGTASPDDDAVRRTLRGTLNVLEARGY